MFRLCSVSSISFVAGQVIFILVCIDSSIFLTFSPPPPDFSFCLFSLCRSFGRWVFLPASPIIPFFIYFWIRAFSSFNRHDLFRTRVMLFQRSIWKLCFVLLCIQHDMHCIMHLQHWPWWDGLLFGRNSGHFKRLLEVPSFSLKRVLFVSFKLVHLDR